jgi:hypothetical protein
VIEAGADLGGNRRLGHHLCPVEQKVVVIEHVPSLLGLDVGGKQPPQVVLRGRTPGKERAQDLVERALGIHGTRIDRKAGALGREARLRLRQPEVVADEIDEIGGILPVVNGERTVETDLRRVFANEPGADGVKSAGPGERLRHDRRTPARDFRGHALDPARHLGGGAAREGQEHDSAGIDAVGDEMAHPVRQGVGLAGAGTGNNQERAGLSEHRPAVFHGAALLRIELCEIGCSHRSSGTNQWAH